MAFLVDCLLLVGLILLVVRAAALSWFNKSTYSAVPYFTGKIQDGGIQASSFALIKNQ
jgi:hypothetical protein